MRDDEAAIAHRAFHRRLNSLRSRLRQVRLCQTVSESERMLPRSDLSWDCGHVYLIQRGETDLFDVGLFKIGKTDRPPRQRRKELQKKTRHPLRMVAKYATVISFELEQALHRHFSRFRVRRKGERQKGERQNVKGELFRLYVSESNDFRATVIQVERWVLMAVEAQLELDITQMEAINSNTVAEA